MSESTLPDSFTLSHNPFLNKHILITGAGSEPGRSVAIACAQHGATVLLLDSKERSINPLYDEIVSAGYPEPYIIPFDIPNATEQTMESLAQVISTACESLDGLVHCALWGAPLTPISHYDTNVWQKVINQQLTQPVMITSALLPLLSIPAQSSIVFTTMDVGRAGRAFWGAVSAAFSGIENIAEVLSQELESASIRVNTLDTGKVKTQVRKKFYPGEGGEHLRSPSDPLLLNHYLYLLSDSSSAVSGVKLTVPALETE